MTDQLSGLPPKALFKPTREGQLERCPHGHYYWQFDARVGWLWAECSACIKEALTDLLNAQDPQFCQGEVYNEGGDEQLDCGDCAWCRARKALGRPEINV
jgi:hypothetical protein